MKPEKHADFPEKAKCKELWQKGCKMVAQNQRRYTVVKNEDGRDCRIKENDIDHADRIDRVLTVYPVLGKLSRP